MKNLRLRVLLSLIPVLLGCFIAIEQSPADARFVPVRPMRPHTVTRSTRTSRSKSQRVVQYSGSRRKVVSIRHRQRYRRHHAPPKPKYAYPLNFFMLKAPDFDRTRLPDDLAAKVKRAFDRGTAEKYPARALIR